MLLLINVKTNSDGEVLLFSSKRNGVIRIGELICMLLETCTNDIAESNALKRLLLPDAFAPYIAAVGKSLFFQFLLMSARGMSLKLRLSQKKPRF